LWGPDHPDADRLREATLRALQQADRRHRARSALDFALRRIPRILEPAEMELTAEKTWAEEVSKSVETFVRTYTLEYLTSDKAIEPFTRLNVAILELLDPNIPGLRELTVGLRWLTRWPSKLVLKIGGHLLTTLLRRGQPDKGVALAPELKAYSDAHVGLLTELERVIDAEREAPRHHPFWGSLAREWRTQLEMLNGHFAIEVEAHMERTDKEIKIAAKDVLQQLEKNPAVLNVLRGVRVAANVGGAVAGIFLPDGGLTFDIFEEAVFIPVVLSSMEAATAAAVKSYVDRRRTQLVARLEADARTIAKKLYVQPLLAVAQSSMKQAGALGIGPDLLQRLPANLRRLQTQVAEQLLNETT
jgi:hypothetical protein